MQAVYRDIRCAGRISGMQAIPGIAVYRLYTAVYRVQAHIPVYRLYTAIPRISPVYGYAGYIQG